ncbi:dihydropyrimidinase [Tricholoma matsutake]|nr:dihydropyrimidinase [Tricholoma matsutake 945]
MEFDLIVRNGIIVNAVDSIVGQEIGIKDGVIVCIGSNLQSLSSANTQVLDCEGGFITPGGVDTHVHFEQWNMPTDDTWVTGTRAAICGGTTTVVTFAAQNRDRDSVLPIVEEYGALAEGRCYCDYSYHLILTNPTKTILEELPIVVQKGITSVKLYMTYDPWKIGDREILKIMAAARKLGITTMVHAENDSIISFLIETLLERGQTEPYYHAVSRPSIAEAEATNRAISLAEVMDTPILLVHISSQASARTIREAQTRLLPIYAETCPQYLWLLSESLKGDNYEGAKAVCSPPPRDSPEDPEAIWRGIANGTFTIFSSDHTATKFHGGKREGIVDGKPLFTKIPNGLPGIETRLPLLYKGVEEGRISIHDFVRVTSSNPAKLYGLGSKGAIQPGKDADLCIWYPASKMKPIQLENAMLHNDIDYTPYEGMMFSNWPRYTLLKGKVVWNRENGGVIGRAGDGQFIKRATSALPGSRNVFVNEWRPPT